MMQVASHDHKSKGSTSHIPINPYVFNTDAHSAGTRDREMLGRWP